MKQKEIKETTLLEDIQINEKYNDELYKQVLLYQRGELPSKDIINKQIKKQVALLYTIKDKVDMYGVPTIYSTTKRLIDIN